VACVLFHRNFETWKVFFYFTPLQDNSGYPSNAFGIAMTKSIAWSGVALWMPLSLQPWFDWKETFRPWPLLQIFWKTGADASELRRSPSVSVAPIKWDWASLLKQTQDEVKGRTIIHIIYWYKPLKKSVDTGSCCADMMRFNINTSLLCKFV